MPHNAYPPSRDKPTKGIRAPIRAPPPRLYDAMPSHRTAAEALRTRRERGLAGSRFQGRSGGT